MTTETTTTSKRPTHRVYAVSRRRDSDKGYWSDIGAAWAHADAVSCVCVAPRAARHGGFSVKLDFLPPLADKGERRRHSIMPPGGLRPAGDMMRNRKPHPRTRRQGRSPAGR